ncbi:MAG: DNA-formamidopyrimidine glycosylase [Desulfobacteraceae bacterium]|nr:MAG: DNA-formamidopyrimidine glycosylase [Desulfobacteraceae bacterium]
MENAMPELPEVQTIVDDLNAIGLIGRSIVQVEVFWPAAIATSPPAVFCRRIRGQTIESIGRRGKFVLFRLHSGPILAVHLRMTGRFQMAAKGGHPCRHVHVVLKIDDGRSLWFHDTRKFGRFYLLDHPQAVLGSLGPEPLAPHFTAELLAGRMARQRRQLKPLLLDQTFMAGLGNIYVDEALWAARLHPLRRSDTLSAGQIRALHGAIRRVLRQGLKHAGTTLGKGQSNFYSLGDARGGNDAHLKVFRRTGEACPRCRSPIVRIVVGQRSTHLCERCQT